MIWRALACSVSGSETYATELVFLLRSQRLPVWPVARNIIRKQTFAELTTWIGGGQFSLYIWIAFRVICYSLFFKGLALFLLLRWFSEFPVRTNWFFLDGPERPSIWAGEILWEWDYNHSPFPAEREIIICVCDVILCPDGTHCQHHSHSDRNPERLTPPPPPHPSAVGSFPIIDKLYPDRQC